jgi:hypothetical protein
VLVFGLDALLRKQGGVITYTDEPGVIFRIGFGKADRPISLADGTRIETGDPIIELHLWNEHIPEVSTAESPIAFGRRLGRALDLSLARLAAYLATRPDLASMKAIHADMSSGSSADAAQLIRLSSRFGFEPVPPPPETRLGRLHRLGENMLILMLVLARNPSTVRFGILTRVRTPAMLSRLELDRRYPVRTPET